MGMALKSCGLREEVSSTVCLIPGSWVILLSAAGDPEESKCSSAGGERGQPLAPAPCTGTRVATGSSLGGENSSACCQTLLMGIFHGTHYILLGALLTWENLASVCIFSVPRA